MKVVSFICKTHVIFVYLIIINICFINMTSIRTVYSNNEISIFENTNLNTSNEQSNFSTQDDINKYLPFVNKKINSEFEPIKIKFVHVDGTVELSKKNSAFTKDTYNSFFQLVMKPVVDYFKDLLKVYPLSKVKDAIGPDQKCASMFTDGNKETRKFQVNLKEALEDNVSLSLLK